QDLDRPALAAPPRTVGAADRRRASRLSAAGRARPRGRLGRARLRLVWARADGLRVEGRVDRPPPSEPRDPRRGHPRRRASVPLSGGPGGAPGPYPAEVPARAGPGWGGAAARMAAGEVRTLAGIRLAGTGRSERARAADRARTPGGTGGTPAGVQLVGICLAIRCVRYR